jgi:hypothetical protein
MELNPIKQADDLNALMLSLHQWVSPYCSGNSSELVGTQWELSGNAVGMRWELSRNAVITSTEYHGSIMGVSLEEVWSMIHVDRYGQWHMKKIFTYT